MIKKLLIIFLLLILGLTLCYGAYFDSPTYDEPANMAASFDYVIRRDFRIYPDNPPLMKMLAGIMLLPIRKGINFPQNQENYADPAKFDLYAFGRDFLYRSENNTRLIIFLCRLPNIIITVLLGIVLYLFAKNLYGESSGLLALFLYALDPNIRGHGHILAFDLPLAFIIISILFVTVKMVGNYCRITIGRKSMGDASGRTLREYARFVLLITFLFALGFLTKFTFIFFAVIYFVGLSIFLVKKLIFIRVTRVEGIPTARNPEQVEGEHWREGQLAAGPVVLIFFSTIVIPFLLLWFFAIITGYNKMTLDYNQVPIIASANQKLKNDFKWKLISILPVPYYYQAGLKTMYTHNLVSQPAFLLGQVHARNDWFFYFPVSFLLKTPILTLILIALTIFLLIKKKMGSASKEIKRFCGETSFSSTTTCLNPAKGGVSLGGAQKNSCRPQQNQFKQQDTFVTIRQCFPFIIGLLFLFFMMLFSRINNVYRYLFPSLILFILGASQIINLLDFEKPIIKLFFIFNILYFIFNIVISFPFDLSYTNEFTGIPPKGFKYLSDSEVDWGQDLERLGNWLKTNHYNQETITLSYLGTADPEYYGISYKRLKFEDLDKLSGLVAISVGNLTLGDWQWTSQPEYRLGFGKAPLDNLRKKFPLAVIGKSIFIYRFN